MRAELGIAATPPPSLYHPSFNSLLPKTCTSTGVEAGSARREFLAYCLSLLRAHSGEHLEQLPVLDVGALKHVAYVLDALVYYMRAAHPQPRAHQLWTPVCS